MLELAGVADPMHRARAVAACPLLRGEPPSWRQSVLIEYYSDTVFPRIRNMGYQAVRTERYKYIDYLELAGMDELYDLQADPYELDNLVGSARGARAAAGAAGGTGAAHRGAPPESVMPARKRTPPGSWNG